MKGNLRVSDDWIPAACTLPTVDQPLRRAEFDDLFARDVVGINRRSAHGVGFELRPEPEVAARAAGLAAKETGCCSFFTFDLTIADGKVEMVVSTGPEHDAVLEALVVRAELKASGIVGETE